jgi:hypothetical protein
VFADSFSILANKTFKTVLPSSEAGNPLKEKRICRSGHSSVLIDKSQIAILGGMYGKSYSGDILLLNTETMVLDKIEVVPKLPPRAFGSATLVNGEFIVLFGGNRSVDRVRDDVVVIRISDWSWEEKKVAGEGPSARCGHCTIDIGDGKVLIYGGWNAEDDEERFFDDMFNSSLMLRTLELALSSANKARSSSISPGR